MALLALLVLRSTPPPAPSAPSVNAAATNARPWSDAVECCSRTLSACGKGERVRTTGFPLSVSEWVLVFVLSALSKSSADASTATCDD